MLHREHSDVRQFQADKPSLVIFLSFLGTFANKIAVIDRSESRSRVKRIDLDP